MKIVGIILAVLMLSLSALVGVLGMNKTMDLGSQVEKIGEAERDALGIPSPGRLKLGGIVSVLGAVAAVGLLIVTFIKRGLIVALGAATAGIWVLAIVLNPSVDTGPLGGMGPRTQAMVAAGMAVAGAVGALLVRRSSSH